MIAIWDAICPNARLYRRQRPFRLLHSRWSHEPADTTRHGTGSGRPRPRLYSSRPAPREDPRLRDWLRCGHRCPRGHARSRSSPHAHRVMGTRHFQPETTGGPTIGYRLAPRASSRLPGLARGRLQSQARGRRRWPARWRPGAAREPEASFSPALGLERDIRPRHRAISRQHGAHSVDSLTIDPSCRRTNRKKDLWIDLEVRGDLRLKRGRKQMPCATADHHHSARRRRLGQAGVHGTLLRQGPARRRRFYYAASIFRVQRAVQRAEGPLFHLNGARQRTRVLADRDQRNSSWPLARPPRGVGKPAFPEEQPRTVRTGPIRLAATGRPGLRRRPSGCR